MSSPERTLVAPRVPRVPRGTTIGVRPQQRVRHGLRDQILVMVLSAVLSLALAGLLSVLLATVLEIGTP